MKIDGTAIADNILARLRKNVAKMHHAPTLAVILIGDNPASVAYIRQKQKAAEAIGARLILSHDLSDIQKFNTDTSVHGIIIQRPLPMELGNVQQTLNSVNPTKDVDGFVPESKFEVPVAMAVGEILKSIDYHVSGKHVVVVGRGETAGAPIARSFEKMDCATSQLHSQTANPEEIMKKADVIISCVGKARIVKREAVKPGAILISVGIWRDEAGRLHGDYEEGEIADVAAAYTPTPGGVGPVNVACLMDNLVAAATDIR